jgi:predicted dehydrogenase
MKVAVLGTGMYVTGRGGSGVGTVLCSLAEISRSTAISEVVLMARGSRNREVVASATETVNRRLNTRLKTRYERVEGDLATAVENVANREGIDAAIVCVPDHLHLAGTVGFLNAGAHCMVVKPMAESLRSAQTMFELQKQRRLHGVVEFHKRFDESNLYARRVLLEGTIGKLLYATVDYSQRINMPIEVFRAWSDKTSIFQYLGVHYVDLIFFLTQARPFRAMAVGTKEVLRAAGVDTHDSIHAVIEWSGDQKIGTFVSQFSVNWIDPRTTTALSDQKYKLVGSQGRLELDQKNRGIDLVHERGCQAVNPYFSEFLPSPDGMEVFQGYGHRSIATFFEDLLALKGGRATLEDLEATRPSFRQSLVSCAVLDAVRHSLEQRGEWVEVDNPLGGLTHRAVA